MWCVCMCVCVCVCVWCVCVCVCVCVWCVCVCGVCVVCGVYVCVVCVCGVYVCVVCVCVCGVWCVWYELDLSCCLQVAVLKTLDHPNLLCFVGVLCNDSKEGKVLNIITGMCVCT